MMPMTVVYAASLNLPTQVVGNTEFYVYTVKNKDNIYSICNTLKISKDDIIKYNPNAADGIKKGQKLFFPVNDFADDDVSNVIVSPTHFNHTVQRGETLYGIAKMYGIAVDDIVSSNPQTGSGVKVGDVLTIPQTNVESVALDETEKQPNSIIFHTIKSGDTMYNVANRYATSIERIIELNPGISPDNFKINDVIKVEPNTKTVDVAAETKAKFYTYIVKKDETFYSIAQNNNISEEQLHEANPDVKTLRKGVYLYIPIIEKTNESHVATVDDEKVEEIYDSIVSDEKATIDIALILPFMLKSKTYDKSARLYTEFYKGFLLAADSLKQNIGKRLNIYAFDSANSTDTIKSILAHPAMDKMDLIFAPDELQQLELVSKFGKERQIKVVNTFIIKNDMYNENSELLQVNIPHSYMYAKVVDGIKSKFSDCNFIFVGMKDDEKNDKDLYLELMKEFPSNSTTIRFESSLTDEQLLEHLSSDKRNIIVPTNSNKKTLSKINIAIKRCKTEHPETDVVLFGYPEWITYQRDYKTAFHNMDTYIYSRFYADENSIDYRLFELLFKKWYGSEMMNAAPVFGTLGFDSGMFFIRSLNEYGKNFPANPTSYDGIQNSFKFNRISNWGGFMNNSVYFIHFEPDGSVNKECL